MDRKISLYVIVPEASQETNYLAPEGMKVEVFKKLIGKNLLKNRIIKSESSTYDLILCSTGYALEEARTLYDYGISDGEKLILWKRN